MVKFSKSETLSFSVPEMLCLDTGELSETSSTGHAEVRKNVGRE